jgi:hypothetical protein
MAVTYNPFESEYGFKSPGFTVDTEGNVTLKSITYLVEEEDVVADRFYMNQVGTGEGSAFTQDGVFTDGTSILRENPSIALTRGTSYSFSLNNFTFLTWNIFYEDPEGTSQLTINDVPVLLYNEGVSYKETDASSTTLTGLSAQGKTTGIFFFEVPALAPSTLYYATGDGTIYGTITTADPTITGIGSFSSLNVIGDVTFTGQDAEIAISPQGAYGTVTINPAGEGTLSNMYVNALTLNASQSVNLSPVDENVTISPSGTGVLTVNSGQEGTINNMSVGQTTPRDGSFLALNAENGLNSTVIGNVTPEDATFKQATGQNAPVTSQHLTNKQYVDNTATALAIALGV